MKDKVTLGARIILGLIYFVFGLNGFLQFMPMPPLPEAAGAFMGALAASGYFFPLLKLTEIAGGAILLSGKAVPFALVLLAPITVQINAFHLVLAPGGAAMGIVMLLLHVWLIVQNWPKFKGLFQ